MFIYTCCCFICERLALMHPMCTCMQSVRRWLRVCVPIARLRSHALFCCLCKALNAGVRIAQNKTLACLCCMWCLQSARRSRCLLSLRVCPALHVERQRWCACISLCVCVCACLHSRIPCSIATQGEACILHARVKTPSQHVVGHVRLVQGAHWRRSFASPAAFWCTSRQQLCHPARSYMRCGRSWCPPQS